MNICDSVQQFYLQPNGMNRWCSFSFVSVTGKSK